MSVLTSAIEEFPPGIVADWQSSGFSSWALGGAWNVTNFSALRGGGFSALWNNANGVGVYPNQSVDPDYIGAGTAKDDTASSPSIDLSLFPAGEFWFRFRVWFRPNASPPTYGGFAANPPEELRLILDPSAADPIEADPNLLDDAVELSRLGGSPWWYEKVVTPTRAVQDAIAGDSALVVKLSFRVGPRDTTDFGIGVERLFVEAYRGELVDAVSDTLAVQYFPGLARLYGLI